MNNSTESHGEFWGKHPDAYVAIYGCTSPLSNLYNKISIYNFKTKNVITVKHKSTQRAPMTSTLNNSLILF